jgi:hypothetical protein
MLLLHQLEVFAAMAAQLVCILLHHMIVQLQVVSS